MLVPWRVYKLYSEKNRLLNVPKEKKTQLFSRPEIATFHQNVMLVCIIIVDEYGFLEWPITIPIGHITG